MAFSDQELAAQERAGKTGLVADFAIHHAKGETVLVPVRNHMELAHASDSMSEQLSGLRRSPGSHGQDDKIGRASCRERV